MVHKERNSFCHGSVCSHSSSMGPWEWDAYLHSGIGKHESNFVVKSVI